MSIHSVVVVGGTHGNELTGVRLIEQWQQLYPHFEQPSLAIKPLMANQLAVDKRVRFIDQDLNRQFTQSDTPINDDHEVGLAKRLSTALGPKSDGQPDLIIDVHNTTSNMGATLILVDDTQFDQQLARYVHKQMPSCNVLLENEKPYAQHPYLCTLGKKGVMIEMGAQPQGVCRADIFQQSLTLLNHILVFCHAWNADNLTTLDACPVYQFDELVTFPLDQDGHVSAMIHPDVQDKDFHAVNPGDPIFLGFDGVNIIWQGDTTTYPHFINEAAYQQSHVAFSTARKILW